MGGEGERTGGGIERLAVGLGAGRLLIGAGLWLAPRTSAGLLGFAPLDPAGLAVARIAATRDVVLGAAQLWSLDDPGALRRATVGAAIADAGDALAFALALRDRSTRSAGARGLPVAALAAAAGAWLAATLPEDKS